MVLEVTPDDFDAGRELTVRVWDSDGPLLKGDFLGQVVFSASELLRIQPSDATKLPPAATSLGLTDGLAVSFELCAKEGATATQIVQPFPTTFNTHA